MSLFDFTETITLYDLTNTYFEGDGRTVQVRKASRPEPHQQAIYDALDLSSNPAGTQRSIL
jgi:hypothetical protein